MSFALKSSLTLALRVDLESEPLALQAAIMESARPRGPRLIPCMQKERLAAAECCLYNSIDRSNSTWCFLIKTLHLSFLRRLKSHLDYGMNVLLQIYRLTSPGWRSCAPNLDFMRIWRWNLGLASIQGAGEAKPPSFKHGSFESDMIIVQFGVTQ